jgi:hypothetical protein
VSGLKLLALSEPDLKVIGECLTAAAVGPIFSDWELSALIGCTGEELAEVARNWPPGEDATDAASLAWGVLLNLLAYPHRAQHAWGDYLAHSRAEVREVFDRWKAIQDPLPPRPKLWSTEDLDRRKQFYSSMEDPEGEIAWPDRWPLEVRDALTPVIGTEVRLVITFASADPRRPTYNLVGHLFRYKDGSLMIIANRSGAPNVFPVPLRNHPDRVLAIRSARGDDASELLYHTD